jgi:PAS domain S-box-containing protein
MAAHKSGGAFIVDAALYPVITLDAGVLITGWNAPAETIFGWSRQEVLGLLLFDTIIPYRSREAHNHCLKRFVVTGGHLIHTQWDATTALNRDGHEFPVDIAFAPVISGQTFTFTGFVRRSVQALGLLSQ